MSCVLISILCHVDQIPEQLCFALAHSWTICGRHAYVISYGNIPVWHANIKTWLLFLYTFFFPEKYFRLPPILAFIKCRLPVTLFQWKAIIDTCLLIDFFVRTLLDLNCNLVYLSIHDKQCLYLIVNMKIIELCWHLPYCIPLQNIIFEIVIRIEIIHQWHNIVSAAFYYSQSFEIKFLGK
jgi:hypothetical protein